MTVRQNVIYPLKHRDIPRAKAQHMVDEALTLVGLSNMPTDRWSRSPAARCSASRCAQHGLSAAIAAARRAPVEPRCQTALAGCAMIFAPSSSRPAMTALYVTHDQAEAVVLGDRIGVMRDGKLLQMDTPDAIYNRPADLFVSKFTGATNELSGTLVARNGEFGVVDFGDGPARRGRAVSRPRSRRKSAGWRCGRKISRSANATAPTVFPRACSTAAIRAPRPPMASSCSAAAGGDRTRHPRPGTRSASRRRFHCHAKPVGLSRHRAIVL